MRRLLLVRHGETAWNAEHRWQGQTDVPLSEVGEAQAAAVARVVAAAEPVWVVSSDLSRAWVTAKHIASACGLSVEVDHRLREFDLGTLEGMTLKEVRALTGLARPDWAAYGGEDRETFKQRYQAALEEAAGSLAPGETGVVVTHGAALRRGLVRFLGWPDSTEAGLGSVSNCGFVELTRLYDDPWRLTAYNRVVSIS